MKAHCLVIAALLVPWPVAANAPVTEKQVVKYAKALDVAKLDPKVSSQRLDKWFESGPARLDAVTWEMSDCDLKGSSITPLCVKIRFQRGSVGGWAIITVGNFRDGIKGAPRVEHIQVGSKNGILPDSNRLSDLPRRLDEEASSLKDAR
jgi:hypothetical protein